MEGQAHFASVAPKNTVYQPLTLNGPDIATQVERLPFSIRIAKNEEDLNKAVSIRHAAYARHVPNWAEQLRDPESIDFQDGVAVLLAESKLDGRALGTMRLQTNQYSPLPIESSIELPDRFAGGVLAQASRLGVVQERVGRVVKTFLFKAYYMYCLDVGVDWMVIAARSPLDRQYDSLLFEDLFPQVGYIPLKHADNIPHRVLALDIATVKARWAVAAHPLYDLIFRTSHPDVDIGEGNLPIFLQDFKALRQMVRSSAALPS